MTTVSTAALPHQVQEWWNRCETWLDEKGKGAWIAAMVLGFVFVWPLGLALLFYMIWSKKMFGHNCTRSRNRHNASRTRRGSSGNSAFDAYKADTLRRLEQEQDDFESFLKRLREAKDKAEFDQFMEDRATRPDVYDHKATGDETGDTAVKPS